MAKVTLRSQITLGKRRKPVVAAFNKLPEPKFGKFIRALREKRKITAMALAQAAGIQQSVFSDIERGKRRPPEMIPFIQRMASELRLQPDSKEYRLLMYTAFRERHKKGQESPFSEEVSKEYCVNPILRAEDLLGAILLLTQEAKKHGARKIMLVRGDGLTQEIYLGNVHLPLQIYN